MYFCTLFYLLLLCVYLKTSNSTCFVYSPKMISLRMHCRAANLAAELPATSRPLLLQVAVLLSPTVVTVGVALNRIVTTMKVPVLKIAVMVKMSRLEQWNVGVVVCGLLCIQASSCNEVFPSIDRLLMLSSLHVVYTYAVGNKQLTE